MHRICAEYAKSIVKIREMREEHKEIRKIYVQKHTRKYVKMRENTYNAQKNTIKCARNTLKILKKQRNAKTPKKS